MAGTDSQVHQTRGREPCGVTSAPLFPAFDAPKARTLYCAMRMSGARNTIKLRNDAPDMAGRPARCWGG
jgi:hypothetical protein